MLFYSIIDIGTCIQHTVHRLVKTAFDKSNTKIKETLKGGFQLLLNSVISMKVIQGHQSIRFIIVQHNG